MTLTEETDFKILTAEMSELDEDIKTQERRTKYFEGFLKEEQEDEFLSSAFCEVSKRFIDFLKEKREKLYQEWKVLYDKKNGEFIGQVK